MCIVAVAKLPQCREDAGTFTSGGRNALVSVVAKLPQCREDAGTSLSSDGIGPSGGCRKITLSAGRRHGINMPHERHGYDAEPHSERSVRDIEGDGKREVVVRWHPDRIEWLYAQGRIGPRQYAAATRLHRDAYLAGSVSYASGARLDGSSRGTGDSHPSETREAAMRRHGSARHALGYGWAIVECVVERNLSVSAAAAAIRIGEKHAMGILWLALHSLADHYGYPTDGMT